MAQKLDEQLYEVFDHICTCLAEGAMWHMKSANECRNIALKGYGEWHAEESRSDNKTYGEFYQILHDKINFTPNINVAEIDKVNDYKISSLDEFKEHHVKWIKKEESFVKAMNIAIDKVATVDMELYNTLCDMVEDVQGEISLVKYSYDSLAFAEWMGHDVSIKSKYLYDYFTKEHRRGRRINFRIS